MPALRPRPRHAFGGGDARLLDRGGFRRLHAGGALRRGAQRLVLSVRATRRLSLAQSIRESLVQSEIDNSEWNALVDTLTFGNT